MANPASCERRGNPDCGPKRKNGGKGQRNSLYKSSGDVRYRSVVGGEYLNLDCFKLTFVTYETERDYEVISFWVV